MNETHWWQTQLTDGTALQIRATRHEDDGTRSTWWLEVPRDGGTEELQVVSLPAAAVTSTVAVEATGEVPALNGILALFGVRAGGRVAPAAGSGLATRPDGSGEIGAGTGTGWYPLVRSRDNLLRVLALPAKPVRQEAPAQVPAPRERESAALAA